jgi:hypothetical protein
MNCNYGTAATLCTVHYNHVLFQVHRAQVVVVEAAVMMKSKSDSCDTQPDT